MKRLIQIALALIFLYPASPSPAAAEDTGKVETRAVKAIWSKGALRISFPSKETKDRRVKTRINSGLPQTIVTRTYGYTEKGKPLALSVRTCRVVYDLWDDLYRVQVHTDRKSFSSSMKTIEEVNRACLQVADQPLGRAADFAGQHNRRIYFAVIIEINPLSDKTVQRIRRWLARPAGRDSLSREAFFGSFVSIFVSREIGSAERIFRFRSQLVKVP